LLQLAQDSAVYGLSSVSLRLVAIVLVPLYARVFSPAEYGVITVVAAIIGVASLPIGLGAEASFAISYSERPDPQHRATVALHYLGLQAATALLAAALLVAFAPWLASFFLGSSSRTIYVQIAALTLFCNLLLAVDVNLFRMLRRPWTLAALHGTMTVTQIAASVVLVAVLRRGLMGHFTAQLGVAAAFFVVSLWLLRAWVAGARFSPPVLAGMVRMGLPYVFTTSSLAVIALADRFFLARLASLAEVGRYTIANSLAAVLGLATNAFQMALWPYLLSIQHEPDARETYARILTAFLAPAAGLAVALSVFAREILTVVTTPAYVEACRVTPYLAFYVVSIALSYIASAGIWLSRQTDHLAWTAALGAAANIGLNLLLIPRFGMMGAGIATLVAELLYVAALFWAAQRCYRIPYRWRDLVWIAGISAALIALGARAEGQPRLLMWGLKILALALYPLALVATRVVEVATLRRLAARLTRGTPAEAPR
jgi:O-antigen/teichoic acid export membrane protein